MHIRPKQWTFAMCIWHHQHHPPPCVDSLFIPWLPAVMQSWLLWPLEVPPNKKCKCGSLCAAAQTTYTLRSFFWWGWAETFSCCCILQVPLLLFGLLWVKTCSLTNTILLVEWEKSQSGWRLVNVKYKVNKTLNNTIYDISFQKRGQWSDIITSSTWKPKVTYWCVSFISSQKCV